MKDGFGREIDYLRISLTDKCNLRCVYCMPEEGILQTTHEEILRFEEIERICRCMARLGFHRLKLTGGEPLVRRDCAALVRNLKNISGIEQVTLTTNGVLLAEQLPALLDAGMDAVNISLDTLDPTRFARITRRDELPQVLRGLRAAVDCGRIPVKVNCVPVSRSPEDEIRIAQLAQNDPIQVRFIEIMPIGLGSQFRLRREEEIRANLERAFGPMTPAEGHFGNGPAHYFSLEGFQGHIGFISAVSHKFCSSCNRVRLTSEGFLKVCLQYQVGSDLKTALRSGQSDEKLMRLIRETILRKPVSHHFYENFTEEEKQDERRMMSQIGG